MGASQSSVCHSCLVPAKPGNDDAELPSTAGREDDYDTVQVKRRVQAVTNIDYGPAGMVPAGATGRVVDMSSGLLGEATIILVDWDAFPRLDRVSVRCDQLTFIAEEKVGPHIMTRNAAVTPTAALSREALEMLPAGMHVEVLEVVHRKVEKRWRGRIEKPVRGWISLVSSEDGHRWASPSRPSRTSFVGMQPAMGPAGGSALGSSGGPQPQAAPAAIPPAAQQPVHAPRQQAPAVQLQMPAPRQQTLASPQQPRQQVPAPRQQAPALRQQAAVPQRGPRSKSFDVRHCQPVVPAGVQSHPPVVVMPGANSRSASFNYGTTAVHGRTSHAASFHLGESSSTTASTPFRPQDSSYRRPSFHESSDRRLVYRQESGSASIPTVRPEEVSRLAADLALLRTPRRVEPAPGAELPAGGWAAAATSLLAPGGGVERRDSQASDVTKAPEDIFNKGVRSVPEGPIINVAPKRDQMFALGADPVGEQWQQGDLIGHDKGPKFYSSDARRTARTEALGPELYMH